MPDMCVLLVRTHHIDAHADHARLLMFGTEEGCEVNIEQAHQCAQHDVTVPHPCKGTTTVPFLVLIITGLCLAAPPLLLACAWYVA